MTKVKFKRKITDSSGSLRIVIPPALAETLALKAGDVIELWVENDKILISRSDKS